MGNVLYAADRFGKGPKRICTHTEVLDFVGFATQRREERAVVDKQLNVLTMLLKAAQKNNLTDELWQLAINEIGG